MLSADLSASERGGYGAAAQLGGFRAAGAASATARNLAREAGNEWPGICRQHPGVRARAADSWW
jgi:hypothetical protein